MANSNKTTGKRKLINALYILLTATLVFLFIMPSPQNITNNILEVTLNKPTSSKPASSIAVTAKPGNSNQFITKDFFYILNKDNSCVLTGISTINVEHLEIPNYIDGKKVSEIAEKAFHDRNDIISATINSVETIGKYSFANCSRLETVTIMEGTERISPSAFFACKSLRSITIPSTVEFVGTFAFQDCTNLREIHFDGTRAKWKTMSRDAYWNRNGIVCTVYCIDGTVLSY
jgi:hypothetical protein